MIWRMKKFLKALSATLLSHGVIIYMWWLTGLPFKRSPLLIFLWIVMVLLACYLYEEFEKREK